MDIFFLDADHNQLIGSMSVEKKSQVISGVLKLGKIDVFNTIATKLFDDVKKSGNELSNQIKQIDKLLEFINEKLANPSYTQLPSMDYNQLVNLRNEGLELERKSNDWLNYVNQTQPLQQKISVLQAEIKRLKAEKKKFRPGLEIESNIINYQNQINSLQNQIIELSNLKTQIEYKEAELNKLKNEGNQAYIDANKITMNSKCKLCGQPITTSDSLMSHKNELLKKVEEIKQLVGPLIEEINQLKANWAQSEMIYNQLTNNINDLNTKISELKAEQLNQNRVESAIEKNNNDLTKIQQQLQQIPAVEQVTLPQDFRARMEKIKEDISTWENYNSLIQDRDKNSAEANSIKQDLDKLANIASELDRYIKLTGPAGDIYSVILNKLANEFSDNQVKYEVRKYTNRGEHLNLESMYNNNGNWVDYEACSSGQKTILDVHFIKKIIPRIGALFMDEFFKHLDAENHDACIEALSNMNIGCIMISSHMESIAAFNNKSCKLELNESGSTVIDYK